MTKSENALGLKVVLLDYSKNYLLPSPAVLPQWMITIMMKTTLKPVRVHLPVVDDLPPEGVFDTEFCNRYEKGGEDGITMIFIAPRHPRAGQTSQH